MDLANLVTTYGPGPISMMRSTAFCSPSSSTRSASSSSERAAGAYFTSSTPTSYTRSPQPPLSPPADDKRKCSLPSISSLLQEVGDASHHAAKRQRPNPSAHRDMELRRSYSQGYDGAGSRGLKAFMPPTPPLRPDSGFHSNGHSPTMTNKMPADSYAAHSKPTNRSSISCQSSASRRHPYPSPASSVSSYSSPLNSSAPLAGYYPQTPASLDTERVADSVTAAAAAAAATTTTSAPAASSASTATTSAVLSASASATSAPSLLELSPRTAPTVLHNSSKHPVTPTWQHHHYFPPSSAASYQQNNDRYICRTCHKAFSRPSSLRIHSHSHTGEKPFRCTHAGCGKAFSVRSNMKRHERGCHTGRPVQTAVV